MQYLFELSKENIPLAEAEALALNNGKHKLVSNLLFLDKAKDYKRLAYTKSVNLFLGTDPKKINWSRIVKGTYCVRGKGVDEVKVADIIWHSLKKPKVDLKHPKTLISILNQKYYCVELYKNHEDYDSRSPQNWPAPHPSSMKPKLARAMVNLTGAKKGETLLDPFCGSGGILIEAGFAGLKPVGSDIDRIMLNRAKINLQHYKIKAKLILQDARKIKEKYDYIATDLPYGLSTKVDDVAKLLIAFLNSIKTKHIVLGLPDFIHPSKILKKSKFKITAHFTHYLHSSLSKEIFVLSNRKA